MACLLYLKHVFNLSDEELVDPLVRECGVAVFFQKKAIAHPVDSRLLEIARGKIVQAAKRIDITLKQTYAKEGKELRRKAGGYAHARQFRRMGRTAKRQRTILGIVL